MLKKLAAVSVVAVLPVALTAVPAYANSQSGKGTNLYTNGPCYQHWDASIYGGISFFSDGDGNGTLTWASKTDVTKTYYDLNHPSVSKSYPTDFSTLFYRVKEGTSERQTGPNYYGAASQYHVSGSGGKSYPDEDTTWTQNTQHTYARGERCGRYYSGQTNSAVAIPPYEPHEGAVGKLQPEIYQADKTYSTFDNLSTNTASTPSGELAPTETPLDGSDQLSVLSPLSGTPT